MSSRIRTILVWVERNKPKSVVAFLCPAVVAYAVVFVIVEKAESPTSQTVALGSARTVAYLTWPGLVQTDVRVILVHGAPTDASSWGNLSRHLAAVPSSAEPSLLNLT